MITRFKVFLDPIKDRERYLNEMAEKGFRLFKSGSFSHQFKKSNKERYKYNVEYIGHLSNKKREDYIQFLEELGIKSFSAPMNLGKIAIGNVRLRPYSDQDAVIATSSGMVNKEIIIAEKIDDGKPFETFSDIEDKIKYLKNSRKPYIYLTIFSIAIVIFNLFGVESIFKYTLISYRPLSNHIWKFIALGCIIGILSILKLINFTHMIKSINNKGK